MQEILDGRRQLQELTDGHNLPLLVVPLVPLVELDFVVVLDAAVLLVGVVGVQVEVGVGHGPDGVEAAAHVVALGPQEAGVGAALLVGGQNHLSAVPITE